MQPHFRLELTCGSDIDAYDEGLMTWDLVGYVRTTEQPDAERSDGQSEPGDHPGVDTPIFSMQGITVPLDDVDADLLGRIDAESADYGEFLAILDSRGLAPEVEDKLEGLGSDLVIIDRARLDRRWRGHGIGRLLIGTGLSRHFSGAQCFATLPCPVELLDRFGTDRENPAFVAGLSAVRRTWESLGFFPVAGDIWIKDPVYTAGEAHVAALRSTVLG